MPLHLTTDLADNVLTQSAGIHHALICRIVNAWLQQCNIDRRVHSLAVADGGVTVQEVLGLVNSVLGTGDVGEDLSCLQDPGNWSFDLGADLEEQERDVLDLMSAEAEVAYLELEEEI